MILGCLPPAEAVRTLVDLANLRGGPDNITVIVVRTAGNAWRDRAGGSAGGLGSVRPVHVAVWAGAGTLATIGVSLLALGQLWPGAASLLAAALLAGGGIAYRGGAPPGGRRRQAKGPAAVLTRQPPVRRTPLFPPG